MKLDETLKTMIFHMCAKEAKVYQKIDVENILILAVYVDDLFFTRSISNMI